MKLEEKLINDEELGSVAGGINGMEKIGFINVKAHDTEIKANPDLNAETVGVTNWGGFGVYEIDTNQGLLWYRIALHKWIAEHPNISFTMYKKTFQ